MERSNRVAGLRKAQGLSFDDLGALCNVHGHTVRRWEKGGNIAPKYWERLAEIFGVTVAFILDLDSSSDQANGDGDGQVA